MDFAWSDEQARLRETIGNFAKSELNEGYAEREKNGEFNHEGWKKCADMGVHGLPVPEEYGGMGLDALTAMGVLERLGYGCKDNGLVFSINEGDHMGLHASASGRIMLAYGSEELRQKILDVERLERFTPLTTVDSQKIQAELPEIRKRGYAINMGETELEVAAVAAPIFDHEQVVRGVIAVVGPVQRFSDERLPGIVDQLMNATRRISISLGATFV